MRSERDLARRPDDCFTDRKPRAVIDDHPPWHAFVGDEIERQAPSVGVEAIFSRPITAAWSTSHRELNFVALSFPVAVEFVPVAFERQRARGIEAHDEGAER